MLDAGMLVCVYTCLADRVHLNAFYESPVGKYLTSLGNCQIVEVYADPAANASYRFGRELILRAEDKYDKLSLKTHEMMRYCVQQLDFQRMLKIDVTCVRSDFDSPKYDGRAAIDLELLACFLRASSADRHYDGFVFHEKASKEGVVGWANKKGLSIDYERVFGGNPVPPFYSGKCYMLSNAFARFVSEFGKEVAIEHAKFLGGAEDVMVGRLFQAFAAKEGL